MIEIEKPTIECVYTGDDPNYGKFVVEPLERGKSDPRRSRQPISWWIPISRSSIRIFTSPLWMMVPSW